MTNGFEAAYVEHVRRGQKSSDDWQTPPHILKNLGRFDLDPCASTNQHHQTAGTMWNVFDGGFMKKWFGRVWLNPPYGTKTTEWVRRLGDHGDGIALVFARVDTSLFQDEIFVRATGCLFLRKRIFFIQRDGTRAKSSGGAPSVLVAYGDHNLEILRLCGLKGSLVDLRVDGAMTRYAKPRRRSSVLPIQREIHA
jgi:hypothetical protein